MIVKMSVIPTGDTVTGTADGTVVLCMPLNRRE